MALLETQVLQKALLASFQHCFKGSQHLVNSILKKNVQKKLRASFKFASMNIITTFITVNSKLSILHP
jgi:hypothetical protein